MFAIAERHAKAAASNIQSKQEFDVDMVTEFIISGRIMEAIKEYEFLSQPTGAADETVPTHIHKEQ